MKHGIIMNGIAVKMKKEFKKQNINLSIKPNPTVFQSIRTDIETQDKLQTARVYRIKFKENNGNNNSYIETKRH